MCSLTLWMTCPIICVFGCNFLDFLQCPNYTKTGEHHPSNGICIWVSLHLMWNVESNNLDDFLCIDPHDLGHLHPIFLTCPNSTKILIQVSVSLYPRVRFHLMQNVELNTMDWFLCINALIWVFFLTCSNSQIH